MDADASLGALRKYVERAGFRGYDPYDALNSPFLRNLSSRHKFLRLAFIQTLKRIPVNLRPLLAIKKGHNPKGLGLFLWGYSKLYAMHPAPDLLEKIDVLLELLDELQSPGYSGSCWGYNFDWQSRAYYLPQYTPTVVNTSFIGHALIDCFEYTHRERALELALSTRDFVINDLNRKCEGSYVCFSYSPRDENYVHNANLLGASLLIRLLAYTNESALKDLALASLGYTMKHQRNDGSWPYAETKYQNWVDSFHTGFNLQSLLYFREAGFASEYDEGFKRGVHFYEKAFFLKDGTPKYYHDRVYPIDIHSAAQAVVFFSRLGAHYVPLAERITSWMVEHLRDGKGYFYYQKRRLLTNKVSYMRWSQAWAFHALTEYVYRLRIRDHRQ
jgi:hypothetical protein